jgi:hypothetical protein
MSFFSGINTQQNTFELGGSVDLIPKNTRVVATVEEAKNDSYNGENYINLKWRVNLPKEYANRVIFQKLKVYTADKQQKAREMLAAIATNASGRLFQAMTAGNEEMPSDASLQTLCNSPMVLLLDVWELDDKKGNWVRSVAPYQAKAQQPAAQPAPVVAPVVAPAPQQPTLDDIPF